LTGELNNFPNIYETVLFWANSRESINLKN